MKHYLSYTILMQIFLISKVYSKNINIFDDKENTSGEEKHDYKLREIRIA